MGSNPSCPKKILFMQYNILNTIYNKEKKLKFLNTKYFISKIIYKIKKFLVNKSSFKFKKSREQYSLEEIRNNICFDRSTLINKFLESGLLFFNNFTNRYKQKINKIEIFNEIKIIKNKTC